MKDFSNSMKTLNICLFLIVSHFNLKIFIDRIAECEGKYARLHIVKDAEVRG